MVFLHGSGERGTDPNILREQGPFHEQLPAIIAAPQCLPSESWHPDSVAEFTRHAISQYHADPKRIYLVGYSMGGYGAWRSAADYPELFAAIVPISGGGDANNGRVLVSIPIWAFHGEKDDAVQVAETRSMVDAVAAASGKPRLTIFPNAGHAICRDVCKRANLWEWLFQQHR